MSDSERLPRLSDDSFSSTLRRFVADSQVDEAAAARSKEHWLRQQLAEASSFGASLTGAAESQTTVGLALVSSDILRCTISLVGADFVLASSANTASTNANSASSGAIAEHLISLLAINRLETDSLRSLASEARSRSTVLFWEAAAALAEDRPEVAVHHLDGSGTQGELLGVTADEIRLRVRSPQPQGSARALSIRLGSVARISSRSWS